MPDRIKPRSSTEPSATGALETATTTGETTATATSVADSINKSLSPNQPTQSGSGAKLTVIDASEQLRSIRKLNTDYASGIAEVNNNSILAPGGASYISPHRMDTKRKTNSTALNPSSGLFLDSSATKVSLERSIESTQETRTSSTNQIPSYSSIFTSSSYRRSMSPPNQQQQQQHLSSSKSSAVTSGNRTSSQRQLVESEIEIPVTTTRLSNSNPGKKLPTFSYARRDTRNDDDDDDDSNDNEFDEHHPFNNSNTAKSTNNRSTSKRTSSESHRCSSPCKHSVCGHKCDASAPSQEHAAHTKISFTESHPPSFSMCQSGYDNTFNRKLDWQDLPMFFKCDCADCYRKRKAFITRNEHHPMAGSSTTYIEKHSRTRSIHLVLKSIILILLTLLLLLLLVGIILAGHFLPEVFDRFLSVSRSFNVTIAG